MDRTDSGGSTRRMVVEPWPGFRRNRLLPVGLRLGRVDEQAGHVVTLDAEDGRLQRAGVFVRLEGDEWVVEFGRYGAWRTPAPERRVTPELRMVLSGLVGKAELAAHSKVRCRVRRWPVLSGAETASEVGILVDETIRVVDGRRRITERRFVTLDAEAPVIEVSRRRLTERGLDRRIVVGYSMTEMLGGADPALWELEDDLSAAVVIHRSLARAVGRLLAHDPVARTGIHVEGVHQMRVAVRSIRSTLRTFAPLLGSIDERLPAELHWLGELLGEVRDLDVLIDELESASAALEYDDQEAAHALMIEARRQRDERNAVLLRSMTELRYEALLDNLRELASAPPFSDIAHQSAEVTLRRFVRRAFRRLRRAIRDAQRRGSLVEDAHVVRLLAKKFRYSLDAIAEVSADAMAQSRALRRLEKSLGEYHDAFVAEEWLRSLTAADEDPAAAFVIGQLVAAQREKMRRSRRDWMPAWRRISRRKARAWMAS